MRYITILVILSLSTPFLARAASVEILTPVIRRGETLIIKFEEAPQSIKFNNKPAIAFPYQKSWRAIVPIDLSTKIGSHRLSVKFLTDKIESLVTVTREYSKTVILPPPPKLGMTTKAIVEGLNKANITVKTKVKEVESKTYFNQPFGLPLIDNRKISSSFGEIRKTGTETIRHLGTDFDASKGQPVAVINAGIVHDISFDKVYGNSVIVNHGRGIYSLYLHLQKIKVQVGDKIAKGKIIGTVGDSGLANAPHLHLSIKISGVSVDPLQFINMFR